MSRPQVTITLGRTGQVVKRAGNVSDGSRFSSLPSAGSKRSTRERVGNKADSSLHEMQSKIKRHRGDGSVWHSNGRDAQVGRNDLRLKLLQKMKFKRTRANHRETNHTGLKRQLPRGVYSPGSIYTLQRMPESKATGLLRRIPPTRSADDLLQLNSSRKLYSTWTHNGLRCRSPDRILNASRDFSPPGNIDEKQKVVTFRPVDSPRAAAYMGKDFCNHSRPTGSIHFLTKSMLPLEATKQVLRLPPTAQKISYVEVAPLTVGSFLHSLGLEKYAISFQAEEVDMTALKQMRDNDLKELGIPMGPRKKILLALSAHSKQV